MAAGWKVRVGLLAGGFLLIGRGAVACVDINGLSTSAGDDAAPDATAPLAEAGDAEGDVSTSADAQPDSGCACPPGTFCADAGICQLSTSTTCAAPYELLPGHTITVTVCDNAPSFVFSCPDAATRPAAFFQVGASAKPWNLDIEASGAGLVYAATADCTSNVSCIASDVSVMGQVPGSRRFAVATKVNGCQSFTVRADQF